jgi:shikimate kinase
MQIVLLGYRGSGKSSVATSLATHLRTPAHANSPLPTENRTLAHTLSPPHSAPENTIYPSIESVDTDTLITLRDGRSIREIFQTDGEAHFRDLESAVLEDVLRWPGDRIIATGGGIVVRESNRNLLLASNTLRIYLRAAPLTLQARSAADPKSTQNRPALTALPSLDEIRALLEIRDPLYTQIASSPRHIIDVDDLTIPQITSQILSLLPRP